MIRGKKWAVGGFLLFSMVMLFSQSRVAYLSTQNPQIALQKEIKAPGVSSVPYQISGNMLLVKAVINEQDGRFLLDTGAPRLVVHQKTGANGSVNAVSLNGEMSVHIQPVEALHWRDTQWKHLEAFSMDLSLFKNASGLAIQGLIGYDLIKDCEMVFDPNRQILLFINPKRHNLSRLETALASVRLQFIDHLPVVELEIDGVKLLFGIDTGAGSSLIDHQACKAFEYNMLQAGGNESIHGLNQKVQSGKRMIFEDIRLGSYLLGNQVMIPADLRYIQQHAPQVPLAGILGMDILQQFKFSINYPEGTFSIWNQHARP